MSVHEEIQQVSIPTQRPAHAAPTTGSQALAVLRITTGLLFLGHLPRGEAIGYIRQRLTDLAAQITIYEQTPPHKHQIGVDLAVSRQLALRRADREWLTATIAQFEREERI